MKLYNKLELVFSSPPKYVLYSEVYKSIWNDYGNRIIDAFNVISHMDFMQSKINVVVGTGDKEGKNNAGVWVGDPMLFRYNVRDKLGTLFHELGHRLIMENDYFEKSKIILDIKNDHQLLDLFLYDVINAVFGRSAADARVLYEKSFPERQCRESWDWAFTMSKSQRQDLLIKLASLNDPVAKG